MGDKELGTSGNGVEEGSTYSVLSFPANSLPLQYKNFVLSKWKRTLRHGNEYFKLVDSDSFYRAYERYTNLLLSRPGAVLRLAVLSDAEDVALGWSLIEGDILHYVYVQAEQRNRGVGRSLVPVPIRQITHLTKAGMSAWQNKLSHAIFNPF